jgi:hypothetical protein
MLVAPATSLEDRRSFGWAAWRSTGSAIVSAAEDSAVPLMVLEINDKPVRDLYDRDFVLVRPDQHITWRGNRVPADMRGLWRRVTGSG